MVAYQLQGGGNSKVEGEGDIPLSEINPINQSRECCKNAHNIQQLIV